MLNDWFRIVFSELDICRHQRFLVGKPLTVQSGQRQVFQHRQIFADELALGVKLCALAGRIEYSEIRLGIAARARCPLPAAVVRRQVKVIELPIPVRQANVLRQHQRVAPGDRCIS